jgi:hypothetical protein
VYTEQVSKTLNEPVHPNGGRTVISLAEGKEAIY